MLSSKRVASRRVKVLGVLAIGLAVWAAPGTAAAGQPLRLELEELGGGPPVIEVVDGKVVFKIKPVQSVSGDLEGTLTERITQVFPVGDDEGELPIATLWKLQTDEGTIEGAYSGIFSHLPDGSHLIVQQGSVFSVTGAYAGLFQARVTYRAVLAADHFDISGRLTIVPRR